MEIKGSIKTVAGASVLGIPVILVWVFVSALAGLLLFALEILVLIFIVSILLSKTSGYSEREDESGF